MPLAFDSRAVIVSLASLLGGNASENVS
jgi:hypothetical protein